MPNHVINEVIFSGLTDNQAAEIRAKIADATTGKIDFSILVPIPIYCWMGSVSSADEAAFKNTALDWCTQNWGTKWNSYGVHNGADYCDGVLTIRFDTAWRPPYGWLAALLNTFSLSFQHNYLSEDDDGGHTGHFIFQAGKMMGDVDWREDAATPEMHTHLHVLRWGVERFDDEEDETAEVEAGT